MNATMQKRLAVGLAAGCLVLHGMLAVGSLVQESVTVDEFGHLPAGCAYWQTGRFALYHHNPPLVKMLAAVPVLLAGAAVDYDHSYRATQGTNQWAFGIDFMWANGERYHALFFLGRGVIVLLSLAAGVVIGRWAWALYGCWGAVLAVGLWSFSPTVLAHGHLATTDLGAAAASVWAGYMFWRFLHRPTWGRSVGAGVVLGLAQLTKYSCLLLYPVGLGAWLLWRSATAGAARPGWWSDVRRLVVMGAIGLLVINLGYGFEGTGMALGRFPFLSRMFTVDRAEVLAADDPRVAGDPWAEVRRRRQSRFEGTAVAWVPVPLPYHYVLGYDEQKLEAEGVDGEGYPQYLLGELRRRSWWYYYFVCLGVKEPVSTLALGMLALASLGKRVRTGVRRRVELAVLLPAAAVFGFMSFLTNINLGIRYLLTGFPFGAIFIGRLTNLAVASPRRRRVLAAVVVAGLGYTAWCAWTAYPHYLSYFNEIAGGPLNGHRFLIDSNLDWGQDLLFLAEKLRTRYAGRRVGVAYFGNVWPEAVGIESTMVPGEPVPEYVAGLERFARAERLTQEQREAMWRECVGMRPGLWAVSLNFVMGLPHTMRLPGGRTWRAAEGMYTYFQRFLPMADRAGHSILIFDLTPAMIDRTRAESAE